MGWRFDKPRVLVVRIESLRHEHRNLSMFIEIPQALQKRVLLQKYVRIQDQVIVGRHRFECPVLARTVTDIAVTLHDPQTNVLGGTARGCTRLPHSIAAMSSSRVSLITTTRSAATGNSRTRTAAAHDTGSPTTRRNSAEVGTKRDDAG